MKNYTMQILCTLLLSIIIIWRLIKTILNIRSVAEFYMLDGGLSLSLLFLILPFMAAFLLGLSIWCKGIIRLVSYSVGVFLQLIGLLYECFVAFIRMMSGNKSYVGQSPLLCIAVIGIAILWGIYMFCMMLRKQ